jgi:hypothetical protein
MHQKGIPGVFRRGGHTKIYRYFSKRWLSMRAGTGFAFPAKPDWPKGVTGFAETWGIGRQLPL